MIISRQKLLSEFINAKLINILKVRELLGVFKKHTYRNILQEITELPNCLCIEKDSFNPLETCTNPRTKLNNTRYNFIYNLRSKGGFTGSTVNLNTIDETLSMSLSLPKCEEIAARAFRSNDNLSTIFMPKIKYIRSDAFRNCQKLVLFEDSLESVEIIDKEAFRNCEMLLRLCHCSLNIPNVRVIAEGAFMDTQVVSVGPDLTNVEKIGYNAFDKSFLEQINYNSITNINDLLSQPKVKPEFFLCCTSYDTSADDIEIFYNNEQNMVTLGELRTMRITGTTPSETFDNEHRV